jgi:hypothetical protein
MLFRGEVYQRKKKAAAGESFAPVGGGAQIQVGLKS